MSLFFLTRKRLGVFYSALQRHFFCLECTSEVLTWRLLQSHFEKGSRGWSVSEWGTPSLCRETRRGGRHGYGSKVGADFRCRENVIARKKKVCILGLLNRLHACSAAWKRLKTTVLDTGLAFRIPPFSLFPSGKTMFDKLSQKSFRGFWVISMHQNFVYLPKASWRRVKEMVFETRKDLSSIFSRPSRDCAWRGPTIKAKWMPENVVCLPQDVFNGLLKVTVTRNTNLPLKLKKTFVFIAKCILIHNNNIRWQTLICLWHFFSFLCS
jgi:hypothetical protein